MNRTQLLEKKAAEITRQLEEWALRENILNSGERIEMFLSTKKATITVSLEVSDSPPENEALSWLMSDMNFSVRARKACCRAIGRGQDSEPPISLRDLVSRSAGDFIGHAGCGRLTLLEIREKLAQLGLKLKRD